MPTDPLYGPKLKIKWAHQHIDEIQNAIIAFLQSEPCVFYKQFDAERSEEVTYVRRARQVPENVVVGASYAVHNLRSALDQLAYALAVRNEASDSKLREVYFPIADSADSFESPVSQRKIAMLSDDMRGFIRMYKPYKGGNSDFWLLHALDILDKHKTLIDVGLEGSLSSFSETSVHPISVVLPGWKSLDEDAELWRHPAGTEQKPEAQMAIVVSLRHVYFGQQREPVAGTLHRIAHLVEGLVTQADVRYFSSSASAEDPS